jgi:hypothetical protein
MMCTYREANGWCRCGTGGIQMTRIIKYKDYIKRDTIRLWIMQSGFESLLPSHLIPICFSS